MVESEFAVPRRMPALSKKISEISPNDIRVRILGTVIDKKDNILVIDDGSGKIQVTFNEPVKFETNHLVRVFGRVMPLEEGFEIQGELVQDMNNVDLELYRKVEELERLNM
jgi:RNase P/RNase MRP subunit p29